MPAARWPVWWGGYGKPIGAVNCLVNGNWHKHMLISIYNNGQRLGFPDGIGRLKLRLAESKPVGSDGVQIQIYQRAE